MQRHSELGKLSWRMTPIPRLATPRRSWRGAFGQKAPNVPPRIQLARLFWPATTRPYSSRAVLASGDTTRDGFPIRECSIPALAAFIFAWPHYLKRDATAGCARNEPRISCAIVAVVRTVLEDMVESGEEAPTPLASRTYSGKFAMRIPPEKHRELAVEAAVAACLAQPTRGVATLKLRVWRHALGRSRVHAVRRTMKAAGSRARGFAELASTRALPSTDPCSSTAARCRPRASRR